MAKANPFLALCQAAGLAGAALLLGAQSACGTLAVTKSPTTVVDVGRYKVFELELTHTATPYANPFWDVLIQASFTSPGGSQFKVEGFYYATNKWRVRFAPTIEGAWSYSLTMTNGSDSYSTTGAFTCVASAQHGWLRTHPGNNKRLICQEGTVQNTLGMNIWTWMYPFINGVTTTGATAADRWQNYFAVYAAHGCNGFRRLLGTEGQFCGPHGQVGIWYATTGRDKYDLNDPSKLMDVELGKAVDNGMGVVLALYDKPRTWANNPLNTANGGPLGNNSAMYALTNAVVTDLHKKYIRYIVNRYAVYVSVWQLFSEFTSGNGLTDQWQIEMADHIRSLDPYNHFVCNSSTAMAPTQAYQDMRTPHLYQGANGDDLMTGTDGTELARTFDTKIKSYTDPSVTAKLPSLFTEFGTGIHLPNDCPDAWRVSAWAAYFCDSGILYWDDDTSLPFNSGAYTNYPRTFNGNAYLSDLTRDYFLFRQQFAAGFPQTMQKPATAPVPSGTGLRAWGLQETNLGLYAAYVDYVLDKAGYALTNTGRTLTINLPGGGYLASWFDPKTGTTVAGPSLVAGGNNVVLSVPDFAKDIALAVRPNTNVTITTTNLPGGTEKAEYFELLQAKGGGAPYTWSVVAGAFPAGMKLNPATGLVGGAPSAAGAYNVTVSVTALDASSYQQALTLVVGMADTDSDTIPDAWTTLHFGHGTGDGTDLSRASDDADGDGMSNRDEYIAGTLPLNDASHFAVDLMFIAGQPTVGFTATAAAGSGYFGRTRLFDLEQSGTLAAGSWTGVPGYTNLLGAGQPVRYSVPAGSGSRFLRVRARLTP